VGWNVVCQPGYVAKEAVAAATDGLGDGRETSGRGNLDIPDPKLANNKRAVVVIIVAADVVVVAAVVVGVVVICTH